MKKNKVGPLHLCSYQRNFSFNAGYFPEVPKLVFLGKKRHGFNKSMNTWSNYRTTNITISTAIGGR